MISLVTGAIYGSVQNPITVYTQGGVGYSVFVTDGYLTEIQTDSHVTLHTHTHVREDALDLFGFPTRDDLILFKLLITVSGIGPKTGLLVMNRGAARIQQAIANGDSDFFTAIPRLGKKNAQKIIIELRSKLDSSALTSLTSTDLPKTKEVVDALIDMGFTKQQIIPIIEKLPDGVTSVPDQIRFVLKHIAKH